MKVLRRNLNKYGIVKTCSTHGTTDAFFIEIEKFDECVGNVSECFNIIENALGKKYPHTKNCKIEKSNFNLILIK